MSNYGEKLAELSPAQQKLLLLRLKKQTLEKADKTPWISPQKRDTNVFPLSFGQQRLWFLDQLEQGSSRYNLPAAFRLKGRLSVPVFEQTIREIVRRHEVFRTSFRAEGGKAVQVVAASAEPKVPFVDLSSVSRERQEVVLRQLALEEVHRPFDLSHAPLLRLLLLRMEDEEHAVVVTTHHTVADAWSFNILMREVTVLYGAFFRGEPSPLTGLEIQYADFACWQRQWLQGEVLDSELGYWEQKLAGAPAVLDLPMDRPRPSAQSVRGAQQEITVSREITALLTDLGRRQEATLFMTLMTTFQVLLHRYTGQGKLVVGSATANRNQPEVEGLIGFFVNNLVIYTDLSGDPVFREALSRVREVTLEAYTHQDLPFERLIDKVAPQRDLAHMPLFQVVLILLEMAKRGPRGADLKLTPLALATQTTKFDLELQLEYGDWGISGTAIYSRNLFDATTIRRLVNHFQNLAASAARWPDKRLSALPLLSAGERHELLVEWNDTRTDFAPAISIHQLFEAYVASQPEAVAVVHKCQWLTYRELDRRAGRLARFLRCLGVGPEVRVGLCVERGVEMVWGALGVLKAGGAYVPLDPAYPRDRIAFMLRDAGVPVLLTQERVSPASGGLSTRVVDLDRTELSAPDRAEAPRPRLTPESLAYVLYTSGSTGRPKGVALTHRSGVNLVRWAREVFEQEDLDGTVASTSICFDVSVFEMFSPLGWGGKLLITGDPLQLPEEPAWELGRLIATVPTAMEGLLRLGLPPALRKFFLGGEAVPNHLVQNLYEQETVVDVLDGYGPSEDTTYTTSGRVPRGWGAAPPIGRPASNKQTYILDRRLYPLPVAVAGELHIGGKGLARGYLERPALTAEKFVPAPFGETLGGRLYKTGDLMRLLTDGRIDFLGRIDHQVKVRGFRIELGEIEAALRRHPAVREAVVTTREDESGTKRLVAYVVAQDCSRDDLRRFLEETLPGYMIPAFFVFMEVLPLTPSGKLDRRALPAPAVVQADPDREFVAPRSGREKRLAAIWEELLKLERVGLDDDFFELGGDSILGVQLVSRAATEGIRFSLRQLFENPTIADLMAVATVMRVEEGEAARQGVVTGPVSLTPVQQWFFELDLAEPDHFNQAVVLKLRRALDPALLAAAVGKLIEHHDALRLRFTREGMGWRQVNWLYTGDEAERVVGSIDLGELEGARQLSTFDKIAESLHRSFDLAVGPHLRVALVNLGAGRSGRLLIVLHHLVVDGVSWRILFEDLQAAYLQLERGVRPLLPPKTTSFKRWAELIGDYARSRPPQLDDWLRRLFAEGPEAGSLPLDRPGGENLSGSARNVIVELAPDVTESLTREVPSVYRTQVDEMLLAALSATLQRWTGASRVRIDLEGHGRAELFEEVDLARTVGWFTCLYPVILEVAKSHDVGALITSVKEQLRRIPDTGVGYGLLRYLSDDREVRERLEALAPAETLFNYLGQLDQALPEAGLFSPAQELAGSAQRPHNPRTHVLEVSAFVASGQLQVAFTYSENLFERSTVEGLAQRFVDGLESLVHHCLSEGVGGYTPSDFSDVDLNPDELDNILDQVQLPGN